MSKSLQLLTKTDLSHFHSLGRDCLFKHTVAQFQAQHFHLNSLRLRRPDVLLSFSEVIDNAKMKNIELDTWVHKSKTSLASTFNQIVADSSRWNGQGVMEKSMIQPLNDSLHAMMCLDLLASDASSKGLLVTRTPLRPFMQRIVEDVSSFSKEKFGVCPEISISGDLELLIVPPFVEFVTVEVLKNAIKAVIDRYGALDIDDAPPIEIHLTQGENSCNAVSGKNCIVFRDHGVGMQKGVADRCLGSVPYMHEFV